MKIVHILIYTLIFIFFFSGLPIHYGVLPEKLNFLPEPLILGLFLAALLRTKHSGRPFKVVGLTFVLFLVTFSLLSTVGNETSWIECILFLRLLLRFYLMFLALLNLGLKERQLRWFITVLAVCLFLQVPVAAFRLLIEGQGEQAIGTYAYHGGGLSTVLPMVMTGFLLSYYIAFRRSGWFLFGILLFVAFGIIGGKRAIFLMVPLTGLIAVIVGRQFDISGKRFSLKLLFTTVVIFTFVFYIAARTLPGLNPEHQFWGSFSLDYIYDKSSSYDTMVTNKGYTTGRSSTNLRAIEVTSADLAMALIGQGSGTLMKSRFGGVGLVRTGAGAYAWGGGIESLGILYGMTGLSFLLLQLGYPATVIWLSFYIYLFLKLRKMAALEREPFWRAYALGCACFCCISLWLSITYTSAMIQGSLSTFLFYLVLSFSFIRKDLVILRNRQSAKV